MYSSKFTNLLDDLVVGQRDPLLVQISIAPLVDQLPDTLQVRVRKEDISVEQGHDKLG